jgi:hypothetical protein
MSTTAPPTIQHPMSRRTRIWIGIGNVVLGILALAALLAAYGLAERLVAQQEGDPDTLVAQSVPLLGGDVPVTLSMSLLLLGAASGLVGSAIQQSRIFASRAGHDTLQQGWVWWYALRPVWSALLGAVFVITLNAGLVSIGDQTTSSAGVTVLAAAGALAGLFTDRVLARLERVLGATPTDEAAPRSTGRTPATGPTGGRPRAA